MSNTERHEPREADAGHARLVRREQYQRAMAEALAAVDRIVAKYSQTECTLGGSARGR